MSEYERPDWAYDGAEVYKLHGKWNGNTVLRRTVVRATATQLVVEDDRGNEERYRLKDLGLVGGDSRTELVPGTHPAVLADYRQREVQKAMEDLREVFQDLQRGAQLYKNDLDVALENARRVLDAAGKAVDMMEAID